MKKNPSTVSLSDFKQKFSQEEIKQIAEEVTYYDILAKFRETRDTLGITQAELAKKAQVNRATLSGIETGMRNATVATLSKLARALGMNLELSLN